MQFRSLQPLQIILRLLIPVEICREMTILQQVEVVIFMPYFRSIDRYAYCVFLLHKYEAHIKGFQYVSAKLRMTSRITITNTL